MFARSYSYKLNSFGGLFAVLSCLGRVSGKGSIPSWRRAAGAVQREDAIEWLAQLLEALEMGHRATLFGIAFIGLLEESS
jgi:hypothetical protein